jgi:hypothetical protein
MSINVPAAPLVPGIQPQTLEENSIRRFWRHALVFGLIGVLIYLAAYVAADQLVYRTAKRNRFFYVKTAPATQYDVVILGASHAAVFDYEDMNAQLEQMTGKKIINLSIVGSGIAVNRLLLDYFLAQHQAQRVVYFLDTFALSSRDWNEDRLQDVRLFDRAPFDPLLFQMLWQNPASQSIALDYTLGFSKINNADRFKADVTDDEATKFKTTYRPVKQIDSQRISYLYPRPVDQAVFQHYLGEFEDMLRYLKSRNIQVTVIKPPLPQRLYQMLPDEAEFDAAIKPVLDRNSVEFYDYSLVNNDEKFFFNPDHLNRTGVLSFSQNYLSAILAR